VLSSLFSLFSVTARSRGGSLSRQLDRMSAVPPVIADGDTSLVLIDSRALTAGQAAVVLLSSVQDPGRTVTIRDSIGFLSTPQTIVVSTMDGVRFSDGTTATTLTQPFSYLTVMSRDAGYWNLTNSFGFPQSELIASVRGITVSTATVSNLLVQNWVSTPLTVANSVFATSTSATFGPTYVSSLIVGPPPAGPSTQPPLTDPGFSMYVQGNLRALSNIDVDGVARFRNTISTGSNVFIAGNFSTLGSVGVRGDVQTLGSVLVPFGSVVASNLDVRGTATFGAAVTMSNTAFVASNLSVGGSVSTVAATTSTVAVTNALTFQEKSITYRTTDLLFSDPITAPAFSTTFLTASNAILTSNLTVTGNILAPTAQLLQLSSTAITNPAGSLTISSIAANSATFSNLISTVQLQASSLTASTILLRGNIDAAGQGYLNIGTVVASTISTGILSATSFQAVNFITASFAVDSLTVTSSIVANNLSTFTASNATIDNRGGTFLTGTALVRHAFVTSSITNITGIFSTPATTLRFTAPTVAFDALSVSSLTVSTVQASTLNAIQISIGAPVAAGAANGPTFSPEFTYPSTNVVITGGPGDYLTPYFLSNVRPTGIGPGDPYTVEASFQLNFNGPQLPGYYASILGLSLFPAGESNSQISIRTYNDSNVITTLYGLFGSNQTYATPPNTGGIPTPTGPLPSSFIHVAGTMYGNSAFSLQFQSRSNDNYVGIDSNNTITINNGVIRWPYYLNGTTIQNSLNDMSVRTLYYYGGLNFASDPALKEGIAAADLGRCYDIVDQIPLRRYRYNDAYISTFHPRDVHRLGILATELEPHFPQSITYTQLAGFPSTVRLVDTQQLDMAHIGATKVLMQRVEALEALVAALELQMPQ
jgi:hypothetical protein